MSSFHELVFQRECINFESTKYTIWGELTKKEQEPRSRIGWHGRTI